MNVFQNISSIDIRDYAKSLGWQQVAEALGDGLFVLNHPHHYRRQLVFPIDSAQPDYSDAVSIVLNKLAEIHQKSVNNIVAAIEEIKDDTLRFRIVDTRNEETFIPLSYAVSALNGAKELFLSAACTVLKPQIHHPRLSRSEALELIDKSKFRHTETGSFVIKVSAPVRAMELQGTLFEDDLPFIRQTTLVINNGLNKLVSAIQTDTLDTLIDTIKSEPNPQISSNLCKAVTNFKEEHDDFDLYVNFTWAGSVGLLSNFAVQNQIKIQKDYFSRIDDVRRELKRSEAQKLEDVFMATVEHLSGEMGSDNQRSGEVILNLYKDSEVIRARIILDTEQYKMADTSHMTADSYLKIKGKLYPGNQPRIFSEISSFELIMP